MAAPSVYAAINAVASELAMIGIPKSRFNEVDEYAYRSIDDILSRLAPLLAKYRLCVFPRVIDREASERCADDEPFFHVAVRVIFNLISVEDGSSHSVETFGEAIDARDKATAKAMSAAYKTAMIQTFCIPLAGSEDPDRPNSTHAHAPEPVEGWEQWCHGIGDIVSVCESEGAIDVVQDRNRVLLQSLSRERPDLYAEIGSTVCGRRQALKARALKTGHKSKSGAAARRRNAEQAELQDG